ncbi:MAG: alpha/beta hydrolase [Clostridium sp.]|uniref:alpha/beta hydrolase n=1 Tax=Clostridium sp. TaxID=1506 RepID=UPI003F3C9979
MKKKNIAKLAVGGAALAGAAFIAGSNYFFNLALSTKTKKDKIFGEDSSNEEGLSIDETSGLLTKEDLEWFESKNDKKDIYILSDDDLKLHAYKIENEEKTHKWAVVVHGYMSSAVYMSRIGKHYYEMGYNLLLIDLRGHGKSEGEFIGMGWPDRLDIINWIEYLVNTDKEAKIVLHGVSMGAGAVMMVSGEELPSNVRAIIEDCGYTSAWNEFKHQMKTIYKLPSFPMMQGADMICKMKTGHSIKDASAIDQVAKSKTPILFIHGDEDEFVPYEMMEELYDAANCDKAIVTIEGAGHAEAAGKNPEAYFDAVFKFADKYMGDIVEEKKVEEKEVETEAKEETTK